MLDKLSVVFKVGSANKWGGNEKLELKYAIRSVVKNFKDLKEVVIVGTKPDWFIGYHIPCDDPFKDNKDSNIILKILKVCADERISENFMNISDDQLIIYPINSSLFKPWTIDSDLRRMGKAKKASKYGMRVLTTLSTLKKEGLPTHIYESHCPVILNKEKYKEILSKYDFTHGKGYVGNTLYFNNILNNGEQPVENVRGFIKKNMTMGQIITECKGKLFLGYQRRALNENLKNYLKQKFPEKTIYEK